MVQDIGIDLSTLPQKELIKQRQNAYLRAMGMITADEMVAAQAAGAPVNPAQIPQAGPPQGGEGGGASRGTGQQGDGGQVGPTAAPKLPPPQQPGAAGQ